MQLRFWGTRGSVPAPGPRTSKYGGNTSCVELKTDDGTHIILDCGTGARELGQHLIAEAGQAPLRLHLFIGHIHWDHIQGFPFFVPAFLPNTELHIYAPRGFQRNLEDALAGQMQHSYFPVKLRDLMSRIEFTQLDEGFFRVGQVLVETQHLNHTAPTIAYRINADGATVTYSTDHEPFWKPGGLSFRHPGDQLHMAFLKDSDLVIHDAQYVEQEYPARLGWGHSTVEYATDVASACGVRRLALFHHDPTRDDAAVERIEQMARDRAANNGVKLDVFAAAEGLTLEIQGSRKARQVTQLPAQAHRPIGGCCVLVVGGAESEWLSIEQQLQEDNLVLWRAPDEKSAMARLDEIVPDLLIVNVEAGDQERLTGLAEAVRERVGRPTLPVVALTDGDLPTDQMGEGSTITDYVVKPFSPPMLRSRVRAWLSRSVDAGPSLETRRRRRANGERRHPIDLGSKPRSREDLLTRDELADLLATVPVFQSLTRDEVDLLTARATQDFYETGRILVHQGDRSDHLFVILAGRVRVTEAAEEPTQTEFVLGELAAGEVVGELGVLTSMPRSATVVATEPTRILAVPGAEFLRLTQTAPGMAGTLLQVLARRIYETDRRVARYAPDPLTGLVSRRAFRDQYPRFAAQAMRRDSKVQLMLVDIDDLKVFNDHYGYKVGDEVVRVVSDALVDSSRTTDIVSRHGGDEFTLLLVDAEPNSADIVLGRIVSRIEQLSAARGLPEVPRCAMGVAAPDQPPPTADELIHAADADMQRRRIVARRKSRKPKVRPDKSS